MPSFLLLQWSMSRSPLFNESHHRIGTVVLPKNDQSPLLSLSWNSILNQESCRKSVYSIDCTLIGLGIHRATASISRHHCPYWLAHKGLSAVVVLLHKQLLTVLAVNKTYNPFLHIKICSAREQKYRRNWVYLTSTIITFFDYWYDFTTIDDLYDKTAQPGEEWRMMSNSRYIDIL